MGVLNDIGVGVHTYAQEWDGLSMDVTLDLNERRVLTVESKLDEIDTDRLIALMRKAVLEAAPTAESFKALHFQNEIQLSAPQLCTLSELTIGDYTVRADDNELSIYMTFKTTEDSAKEPKILTSRSTEYEAAMQMQEWACATPPKPGKKFIRSR